MHDPAMALSSLRLRSPGTEPDHIAYFYRCGVDSGRQEYPAWAIEKTRAAESVFWADNPIQA